MKFIKNILVLALILSASKTMAQSPVLSVGNVETADISEQFIAFKTTNAYGKIIVYNPSVIRVRLDKKPIGRDFSYAVIATPQKTKTTITQDGASITLVTDSLKAIIYKKPFRVAYYTLDGQVINQDEPGLSPSWVNDAVTDYKTMMPDER